MKKYIEPSVELFIANGTDIIMTSGETGRTGTLSSIDMGDEMIATW